MAKATILPPSRRPSATESANAEVDTLYMELMEAERAHRAEQFWKRFGAMALAISLIVVLGTGGFVYYRKHQQTQLSLGTAEIFKADELIKKGKPDEAAALFAAGAENGGKLAPLMRLRQAEALSLAGKQKEAMDALRLLTNDPSIDPALRDTARLSLARQTQDPEEMRRELAAAAVAGAPFAPLAQQMRAALAMAENKPEEALAALNTVDEKDVELPQTLLARNAELRMVFTPNQAVNKPNAPLGEEVEASEEEKAAARSRRNMRREINKAVSDTLKKDESIAPSVPLEEEAE